MPDERASLFLMLVELLGSAATYNEKGFHWMQHDSAQVREVQREYAERLNELAARFGPAARGGALASAIDSGAAARDDGHGHYAGLAEQILGVRRSSA
jgi:hypothetical protein